MKFSLSFITLSAAVALAAAQLESVDDAVKRAVIVDERESAVTAPTLKTRWNDGVEWVNEKVAAIIGRSEVEERDIGNELLCLGSESNVRVC